MTTRKRTPRKKGRVAGVIASTSAAALALVLTTASVAADRGFIECSVPSAQYPTLQSAIAEPSCDGAALAAGDYLGPFVIDRTFTVRGPTDFSARLLGRMHIDAQAGDDVQLNFVRLEIDPLAGLLFSDGFESGDTNQWSSTTP